MMLVRLTRPRTSRLTLFVLRRLASNSKDIGEESKEDRPPFSGVVEKSLNRVTLLGRAGADPRISGTAHPVVSFPLATNRPFRDPDTGAQRTKTEWHRVAVFAPALRDSVMRDLSKGTRVRVAGREAIQQHENIWAIIRVHYFGPFFEQAVQ